MTTTDFDKLRAAAQEALRSNDNNVKKTAPVFARVLIENARRPLLVALCVDYLSRLPSAPKAAPTAKQKPPKPIGRRRQGKHRRPVGTPTPQQKAGAVAAGKAVAHEIFVRRIRGAGLLGNIRIHELRAIAESQASTAASFLQRGYDDAVEAIACITLSGHCVAADPFAKVADVIPANVAVEAFEDAKLKAAEVIRDGSAKVAHDLIAAARGKPLVEGNETRQ
jgi:hypothetical protein